MTTIYAYVSDRLGRDAVTFDSIEEFGAAVRHAGFQVPALTRVDGDWRGPDGHVYLVERVVHVYWTCEGDVRGGCGIRHRTEGASQACCDRDTRNVKRGHSGGAYSDRRPVRKEA